MIRENEDCLGSAGAGLYHQDISLYPGESRGLLLTADCWYSLHVQRKLLSEVSVPPVEVLPGLGLVKNPDNTYNILNKVDTR